VLHERRSVLVGFLARSAHGFATPRFEPDGDAPPIVGRHLTPNEPAALQPFKQCRDRWPRDIKTIGELGVADPFGLLYVGEQTKLCDREPVTVPQHQAKWIEQRARL